MSRAAVRAGMVVCGTDFATANPTLCRAFLPVRPTKVTGDIPFGFPEILTEDGLHTAGTQQRVLEPSFVFVMRPIENSEQVALADEIVDTFTEHLKDYAHIAADHVWSRFRTTEEGSDFDDGTDYPTIRFTLLDVTQMTGRTS